MGLSTAEKNRRKRERKKQEREAQKKVEDDARDDADRPNEEEVEIEYIAEPTPEIKEFETYQRFQELVNLTLAEKGNEDVNNRSNNGDDFEDDLDGKNKLISKRKLRESLRPSIAALKQQVKRPDLVEAHDVTAADPFFLIELKAAPGTVPVSRHWGRKRKYLQGKRGFEKPPFQLPDFIVRTGITDIRDSVAADEAKMSAKQKNRARVAPKMGAIDVDYRTLHDAFFKYQTKPKSLTKFGDTYYEGKELEVNIKIKPGGPLSSKLREALGMTSETSPPPWLINMQRYGPPPTYPMLVIPGLNAPLPTPDCVYGYHPGGWGKPPVDNYGRPLYGGNPFDPPGSSAAKETELTTLVTSDGKTIQKALWGALPVGAIVVEESEEESSDEEMDESSEEEGEENEAVEDTENGIESVLPPPSSIMPTPTAVDLRKQPGDETPVPSAPKQLYQVVEQSRAGANQNKGAVFASEMAYVLPGAQATTAQIPDGVESVLAKGAPSGAKRKRKDDDEDELDKNFKF
jgi:splicing factor 3B subunit 2